MDPSELPAMFAEIEGRVNSAASPAVLAMAHQFERALKQVLSRRTRGAGEFRDPGERGEPPAMRSGRLRDSVMTDGGGGGPVAVAGVGPHAFYAGVQEWGHTMHARPGGYMRFRSGGEWNLKTVHVGPNPYMGPALRICIGDGSLGRAAEQAFDRAVWGR